MRLDFSDKTALITGAFYSGSLIRAAALRRRVQVPDQAQRFLSVNGVIQNLFRLGRHRLRSENYRLLRARSFEAWSAATGV